MMLDEFCQSQEDRARFHSYEVTHLVSLTESKSGTVVAGAGGVGERGAALQWE